MPPQIYVEVHGEPGKVYRPGDKVQGEVTLRCTGSEDVECILISFIGMVWIWYHRRENRTNGRSRSRVYKDEHILFDVETRPFVGPYTIQAGEHKWPFEYTVPHGSTGPDGMRHPLPPTLEQGGMHNVVSAQCSVTYTVKARMMRPAMLKRDARAEQQLTMIPFAPAPAAPMRFFDSISHHRHASSRLQPGRENTSRSISEALRDTFGKDAPAAAWGLRCSICDTNVEGAAQASLTLNYDVQASTATSVPEFRVVEVTASLVAYTSLVNREYSRDRNGPRQFENKIRLDRVGVPTATLVSGESHQVTAALPNVPPSFMSQGISRWYGVVFKVKIECVGKSFESRFEAPVNILAPTAPPTEAKLGNGNGFG